MLNNGHISRVFSYFLHFKYIHTYRMTMVNKYEKPNSYEILMGIKWKWLRRWWRWCWWWNVMCANNNKRYKGMYWIYTLHVLCILPHILSMFPPRVFVLSSQTLKLLSFFLARRYLSCCHFVISLDIVIVIAIFIALPISTIKLNGQWCAMNIGWMALPSSSQMMFNRKYSRFIWNRIFSPFHFIPLILSLCECFLCTE